METFKPIIPFQGRAALLATACLIIPLTGGEINRGSNLASNEVSRRQVALEEAQELLLKGDEAYTAQRYSDAVEAYAGARDLIPNAPASAELRAAATQRYAQASVQYGRELSRKGDVAKAKETVNKVLAESVDPKNPEALNFRAQLDDPIRTNPALTAQHAKNVDAVRRGLYTAEGEYNLGKFDEAKTAYEGVLRIDSTNTAARRGMEKVSQAKSTYHGSSYDHARAEMLSQVEEQWEIKPNAGDVDPSLIGANSGLIETSQISVRSKLERIIIPKIALDQSSLEEALDFLRVRSAENDTLETDPDQKGVNFALNLGAPGSPEATGIRAARFDLQLTNVPLSQALKYLTEATKTSFKTDDFSVIITPAGSSSNEMVTRTYRVPPDFISSMSSSGAEGATADDPFASAPAGGGRLAKRQGAQEVLQAQGVQFPEGAMASYTPKTGILRVINTETNQDFVSQLVETVARTEPVLVSVKVTMIKVEQNRLEELGFDWLLDNFGFAGDGISPGSSQLNLSGGTIGNGSDLNDLALPVGSTTRNPITAGNRSGDAAISGNSIDGLLTGAGRQQSNRAPGIFGTRGTLNNADVQMLMRGLDQKKGVDVMSKPSVMTRSGQSSSISVVREFMYATEYEPPELPNSTGDSVGGSVTPVTPATPTAFQKRDVGTFLEVLPVVDEGKKYITVTLNPVFSDFDGFVNYGSPINTTAQGLLGPETVQVTENAILMPIFSKQSLPTTVDVADGATVVIGGLKQDRVQTVNDKTPILGDLPIVGRLFQTKARSSVSTAIIFLVNVELMDPTGRAYRDR